MFEITIKIGRTDGGESSIATRGSWSRLRQLIKKRDGAKCQYCGCDAQNGEVDHVLALSRGGTDAVTNLVWSCKPCNLAKGSKYLREWLPTVSTKEPLPPMDITYHRYEPGDPRTVEAG